MNSAVKSGDTIALDIKTISLDGPWSWLALASKDMMRKPVLSLGYGLLFAVVSALIVYLAFALDMAAFAMALGGGFMLVGPMLAVGLYEMSRRHEQNKDVAFNKVFFVATKSPTQLAFLGALLMIALLIWIRIATLLFALFWGTKEFPPLVEFLPTLLFTIDGLSLLIVGSIAGGLLAFVVFGMSVISVPLLMERDVDAITAIIASFTAIKTNFWPMMLWALLIGGLSAIGIATLFVGLIFTFPLVGHGTWHAYRALVD